MNRIRTVATVGGAAIVAAGALFASGAPAANAATPVKVVSASWNTPSGAWVLGSTGCAKASCTTVAQTSDGGASWARLSAPASPIATRAGNGVDAIERADDRNGYVYGPQLFSTHDGASSWRPVAIPGGGSQVTSLTVANGYAYIAVNTCPLGGGSPCAAPATVWRSPLRTDRWTQLSVSLPSQTSPSLTSSQNTVYLTAATPSGGPQLSVSTDGLTFTARPTPCTTAPSVTSLQVAPSGGDNALLLCSGDGAAGSRAKRAFVTTDAALTSTSQGDATLTGTASDVSAQGRVGLVGVSGSRGLIQRTADAGASFTTVYQTGAVTVSGVELIGLTGSAVQDPAVYPGANGELLLSHDGGRTWASTPVTV